MKYLKIEICMNIVLNFIKTNRIKNKSSKMNCFPF